MRIQRQFADFVQEERSAIGCLEDAAVPFDGPGERASLVASEGTFQQLWIDAGAVEGDEWLGFATGFVVDLDGDGLRQI